MRSLQRRLEKQTAQLSRTAGKSVDWVTDTAKNVTVGSGRYIKKNPWSAVVMTAAAALLVGALLGRRRP